jgi:acyl carrier protein
MTSSELDRVVQIVCEVGKVPAVLPDQDVFEAGMSSIDALPLLTELEDAFAVTIPDDEYISCRTPRQLYDLICRLQASAA